MEIWFVYICRAKTGRYYVGISQDPQLRLERHNSGHGSQFARDQGPFILVFTSKAFTKKEARIREIKLKGWSREKKNKLIAGEWILQ
jgi:predicted GIY-YIG superfamily endonuclease